MHYYLKRYEIAEDQSGIFGSLSTLLDKPIAETFELPWRDNKVERSCIPTGQYECEVIYTNKHGRTILVKDVPGRTDILFHIGNTATDTRGCILVGKYKKYAGVRDSRRAMGDLLLEVPDRFLLTVEGIH